MIKESPELKRLKKFAAFLNENLLQEVVNEQYRNYKESGLIAPTYSEEDFFGFTFNRTREFLKSLSNENALELNLQSIKEKKNEIAPGMEEDDREFLLQDWNKQKQTLLSFIPSYTEDVQEAIAIAKELEAFFSFLKTETTEILPREERHDENELLMAMEIAQIGSYTWLFEQDLITITPQLYKIFDFTKNESLSIRSFTDMVHPDDKEMFTHTIQQSIENKWPLDVEYRIIRKDLEERIVWGKGQTTYKDGKPIRMQGTILDVTEKRLTEIEVQYREAQLVEAQAIAGIGSFDWDFVNNKSTCTAELYRIFGWPRERELNFRTFEALSHPDDIEKVFLALHNAMENKAPYDCEYRIILPDESQKWVWARGKVTFDQNGNGIRLTGTVLDITERKLAEEEINRKNQAILSTYQQLEIAKDELQKTNLRLEERVKERTHDLELSIQEQKRSAEELRKKNKQLEKINADLDNFVYTASHDLKAPITNIEGLVTLLAGLEDKNDPRFSRFIELINTSIQRFKTTIKDLTEISKVQKDINDDAELLNLPEELEGILFDIRSLIEKNAAIIKIDFAVQHIEFSRKNMRSIFYNLVSNALKFRKEQQIPTIAISSRKEGNFVIIEVTDNGLGIPPDKKERIFSMFRRLHSHVEGSGVGLYIVKRIVDNAGGKIEVKSEVGKGTSFLLHLPYNPALILRP